MNVHALSEKIDFYVPTWNIIFYIRLYGVVFFRFGYTYIIIQPVKNFFPQVNYNYFIRFISIQFINVYTYYIRVI